MSVLELKEEAIRQFAIKVEAMDDEADLKMVLEFPNEIRTGNGQDINLSHHYEGIKLKYGTVLEKLAK